jgi:mRNA interferase HicA
MKRTKFLKHLYRHGCYFVREGARHTFLARGDGSLTTAVPRHAEIRPDLIRKICKDVDIPPPSEK